MEETLRGVAGGGEERLRDAAHEVLGPLEEPQPGEPRLALHGPAPSGPIGEPRERRDHQQHHHQAHQDFEAGEVPGEEREHHPEDDDVEARRGEHRAQRHLHAAPRLQHRLTDGRGAVDADAEWRADEEPLDRTGELPSPPAGEERHQGQEARGEQDAEGHPLLVGDGPLGGHPADPLELLVGAWLGEVALEAERCGESLVGIRASLALQRRVARTEPEHAADGGDRQQGDHHPGVDAPPRDRHLLHRRRLHGGALCAGPAREGQRAVCTPRVTACGSARRVCVRPSGRGESLRACFHWRDPARRGAALSAVGLVGLRDAAPAGAPDAGPFFTADLTAGKFGEPLPSVTAEELASFRDGKDAFLKQENIGTGLGPVFNQPVCTQCHDSPPAIGGSNQRLETRYGRRLAGRRLRPSHREGRHAPARPRDRPGPGLQLRRGGRSARGERGHRAEDPAGVRPRAGGCHPRFGLPGTGRFPGPRGAGGGGAGADGDRSREPAGRPWGGSDGRGTSPPSSSSRATLRSTRWASPARSFPTRSVPRGIAPPSPSTRSRR